VILSFNSTANYCGIAAGAALGGLIVDHIGLHSLPWISATIGLAALLSCLPMVLTSLSASRRPA
jgi:predicted MFS family arabinose efflux permease